jgi:phosphatidate cytidylyltransferase
MADEAPADERPGTPRPSPPFPVPRRSLRQALLTGAASIAVLVLASYAGTGAFFVLVSVAVAVAMFEAIDALVRAGRRPSIGFGLACGLALQVVAYVRRPVLLAVVFGAALYGLLLLSLRPSRGPTPIGDASATLLVLGWVGGGGAAATSLLMIPGSGRSFLLAFIAITAADDTVAYFVGANFGKRKLAPLISPGKTWEGFIGGLAGALVAGLAAGALVGPLGVGHGAALGALCGLLAPAGDLVESLFKRELQIKDSGRLLPGHGGFLDRLDAMIFCAPWALLYVMVVVL